MAPETYKWLQEVLFDAERCSRLTPWESSFLNDIRERVRVSGRDLKLSDRQLTVIQRIEKEKVYAS